MSDPRHPGYTIGDHWLETAYSRICAGENETETLADYGYVPAAKITRLRAELQQVQDRLRLAETNAGQMLAEADMAANRVKNDLSICRTRLKLAHRIIAITTEGADDSDWTDLREWRAGR